MKILSWDVGIKNLAYSIIEFTDKNKNFTILNWDVINLIDDTIKCNQELRGENNKCCSTARYIFNIKELDNKPTYYCKAHMAKIGRCASRPDIL